MIVVEAEDPFFAGTSAGGDDFDAMSGRGSASASQAGAGSGGGAGSSGMDLLQGSLDDENDEDLDDPLFAGLR